MQLEKNLRNLQYSREFKKYIAVPMSIRTEQFMLYGYKLDSLMEARYLSFLLTTDVISYDDYCELLELDSADYHYDYGIAYVECGLFKNNPKKWTIVTEVAEYEEIDGNYYFNSYYVSYFPSGKRSFEIEEIQECLCANLSALESLMGNRKPKLYCCCERIVK